MRGLGRREGSLLPGRSREMAPAADRVPAGTGNQHRGRQKEIGGFSSVLNAVLITYRLKSLTKIKAEF